MTNVTTNTLSAEQTYTELQAENEDVLEAAMRWYEAGCPGSGSELGALRRCVTHQVRAHEKLEATVQDESAAETEWVARRAG